MNKNVKRIIAIALAFGAISAIVPATNTNLLITKVYADSDDENGDATLDSLSLESSSGSTIKLYSDSGYDSDSKLDEDDTPDEDTYFAKTSSSTINVNIDGPNSRYVKVFRGTSDSTKGKSISNDISLSSGTTNLVVRVYYNKPDSDIKYEDDSDVASEYKIKVKYTGSDSDSEDASSDDFDDIYLDKLSIHGESIELSKSKTTYSYNVASDIDEVTIKAVPDDEDDDFYTVTIDGEEVDSDDKFKTTVELDKGVNDIKVKLEDEDDNYREYTLKINRGSTSTSTSTSGNTATSTPGTATNVATSKTSQWVQVNGKWQYNDAVGNPIKNMWFYDKNYGKNYYLQEDGTMATGWLNYNGAMYYLGTDGAIKTGWQAVSGSWYYLNGEGKMQTGWIKDSGKYYYLNSNGIMAYNTTIGGYKLGADGAWIGR